MSECKNCKGRDVKPRYQPLGKKIFWSEHEDIKKLSKFTRNDRYYSSDRINKPCMVYTCETCGYRVAKKLEK